MLSVLPISGLVSRLGLAGLELDFAMSAMALHAQVLGALPDNLSLASRTRLRRIDPRRRRRSYRAGFKYGAVLDSIL
jgi:hypothetical protein